MKRGVEMSMNLIVTIVIALIILTIIVYLVSSNSSRANNSIGACVEKGGQCRTECGPGEFGSSFFNTDCQEGEICCSASPFT